MQWDDSGRVRPLPRGSGWRKGGLPGSHRGSRNDSGVWHSVKVCGNAANLRAYRARQRVPSAAD
ncbi:CGNR zinc finger domain-containing protein [Streptomyces sp. 900105755]